VRSAAVTWGKVADIAYDRGELDEALRIRREVELPGCERLGDVRAAAVAWGKVADIAYDRGELDEALRIRREVQLPVYERLGDVREAAVAWGKVADIAYRRGELDEALRIRREVQLPVYERLGDLDSIAAVTWKLAQIDLVRKDHDSAFPQMVKSFQIYQYLQRPDGIAVVGSTLGRLLMSGGATKEARRVLEASVAAAAKIGWADMVQELSEMLNSLPPEGEGS
jgi:tetratricopeptide (TPR) repeat protein